MKDLGTASGVVMSQVESAAVPTLADLALVAAGHRVCTHLALSGGGVYATVGNPHYHPNAPSGSFMPPSEMQGISHGCPVLNPQGR